MSSELQLHQSHGYIAEPEVEKAELLLSTEIVASLEQKDIPIDNSDQLASSLDTLRQDFGIQDEAFADFKRTIVLTAAADRLSNIEGDSGQQGAEMEYISDLVMGIAGEYTEYAGLVDYRKDKISLSDEHKKAVYEKYTQHELTQDMDNFIHGPALDELRQRLGVTDEQPFTVKVLSIDAGNSYGHVPYVDYGDEQLTREEFLAIEKEQDVRENYKKGLEERTKRFAHEQGREGIFAVAWVSTLDDGTRYLCLDAPLAEKVMYSDSERAKSYSDGDREHDLAIVLHEYTHTQQMLTEGKVGLGIALEELRAEHFSGNKQGYQDIKRFYSGVKMLTGYSPADSFEIDGNAYNQDEFLADIARNLGLNGLLDTMVAIPENYVNDEDTDKFIKAVVAHNGGGLSGQFQKIYDRLVEQEGFEAVETRISTFVDQLYDVVKDKEYITIESWFAYAGISSFRDLGIENFRRRHPDKSDGYDYSK